METRIAASERTSQKLSELLTQGVAEGDARSELIRLAVRKIVEESLEAEVAGAVGRGYYESGAVPGAGYRNGYRCGRLRTAEGPIDYGVPQVAGHQATARLQGPRERHPRRFVSSPRFRPGSRRSRAIASGDRLLEDLRLDLVRAGWVSPAPCPRCGPRHPASFRGVTGGDQNSARTGSHTTNRSALSHATW